MGEVYRTRDTRFDRTVAIKILPAAVAGNSGLRERFDRDARAVAALMMYPLKRRLHSHDSST
jgi:serine/threonine-protein kinase